MEEIISKYGIRAKKSLGQNFLVDQFALENISNCIEINNKNIIEIGPGYGALTQKILAQSPTSLTAVELDKSMVKILEDRLQNGDFNTQNISFEINNIDVLKFEPKHKDYYVIANIPYYITSPILRHFLYNLENKPEKMVILMQKDVGDKILKKNKNKSSVISLIVDKKATSKEIMVVPKQSFIPAPKITSSVLLFEKHNKYQDLDDSVFLKIIKKGFSSPRKKLVKNLSQNYDKEKILSIFEDLGISKDIRGEDLDINIWCKLVDKLKS